MCRGQIPLTNRHIRGETTQSLPLNSQPDRPMSRNWACAVPFGSQPFFAEAGETSLCFSELLHRDGIADVVERFVAGKAYGLIHAGLKLLVGAENRIVPVCVAQHIGDVFAPILTACHGRVLRQLLSHIEAIGTRHWPVAGVELRRVHICKQ
jgi:hypothetical protein